MFGIVAAIAVTAGVALASWILYRLPLPRALRLGIAAIALYCLVALVYGVSSGASLISLLSDSSLGAAAPWVLQGAVMGCLVLLPLALIVIVLRMGIPRFRSGAPRLIRYQLVSLVTSLAIVLVSLPRSVPVTDLSSDNATTSAHVEDTAAQTASLERSFRAIQDGERESPRDRWDLQYVVDQVGTDPAELVGWVHANTSWVPYAGTLRGPVGVLMDGLGNSLDRSLLLATLLQQAGHSVRMAHASLSDEQARELLPQLLWPPPTEAAAPPASGSFDDLDITRAAADYELDGNAIRELLSYHTRGLESVWRDLASRVADQSARLEAAIAPTRPAGGQDRARQTEAALKSLRDHWWVQRREGDAWVDLDLLTHADHPGQQLATANETLTLDDVGRVAHQIVIRVVAERTSNGTRSERTALEHVLRPSEVVGEPVVIQFWPTGWPELFPPDQTDRKRALLAGALAQREWRVSLVVGADVAAQTTLDDRGAIEPSGASNPMSGLGARLSRSRPATDPSSTDALTAVWLEYEIRVPDAPPQTIRRAIFDLVGPAARSESAPSSITIGESARLHRSLSLTMRTEILPVVCDIAPEFVAHLTAQGLLANRELLGPLLGGEVPDELTTPEGLAERYKPMPTPLYSLAVMRLTASRLTRQVYIDRPNILTRHVFLAPIADGITTFETIDIVSNEVGVSLTAPDDVMARLEQGVRDTNAEAMVPDNVGSVVAGNVADAFATSRDWIVVTSTEEPGFRDIDITPDLRQRIAQDLRAGHVAIVPRSPVSMDSQRFLGWWRVDPATGSTLGFDSRGWGAGQLVERAALTFIDAAIAEFLFCEALHEFVAIARDREDWIGPKDGTGAFALTTVKSCAINAIFAGVFATLPLLLLTINARLIVPRILYPKLPCSIPRAPVGPAPPTLTSRTQPRLPAKRYTRPGVTPGEQSRWRPGLSGDLSHLESRLERSKAQYFNEHHPAHTDETGKWIRAVVEADQKGLPRPAQPASLRQLEKICTEKVREIEDLEEQIRRAQREAIINDKRADAWGSRTGDTRPAGPSPAARPSPGEAPAPRPTQPHDTLPEQPGAFDKTEKQLPGLPGCPPNCGNSNPTLPQNPSHKTVAGVTNVSSTLQASHKGRPFKQ